MSQHYWAVVPAAGAGRRMGADKPKQYLEIAGCSILQRTLQRLHAIPEIERIVLVTQPDDPWLDDQSLEHFDRVQRVDGGAERVESVLKGLQALSSRAAADDWVLVHDVVRPCITAADIRKLMQSLDDGQAGGLLASPLRETIKQADEQLQVSATVDRSRLWAAATPQQFRYQALLDALQQVLAKGLDITDEAAAMEACGHPVQIVPGRSDNLKITHPADLALAGAILLQQAQEEEGLV